MTPRTNVNLSYPMRRSIRVKLEPAMSHMLPAATMVSGAIKRKRDPEYNSNSCPFFSLQAPPPLPPPPSNSNSRSPSKTRHSAGVVHLESLLKRLDAVIAKSEALEMRDKLREQQEHGFSGIACPAVNIATSSSSSSFESSPSKPVQLRPNEFHNGQPQFVPLPPPPSPPPPPSQEPPLETAGQEPVMNIDLASIKLPPESPVMKIDLSSIKLPPGSPLVTEDNSALATTTRTTTTTTYNNNSQQQESPSPPPPLIDLTSWRDKAVRGNGPIEVITIDSSASDDSIESEVVQLIQEHLLKRYE